MGIAWFSNHARAQSYPTKPVRIIVATSAGGGTDFIARLIAQKLTESFSQQVIVENRAEIGRAHV